jgi:long-subunit acyl-CoA synthetase (AMP-forming)
VCAKIRTFLPRKRKNRILYPTHGLASAVLERCSHHVAGSVKITGRVKEIYKLRNGKYVVPGPIEEAIRASPYVNQLSVYGENRPFNIVIIVPHPARLAATLNADADTVLKTHKEEVRKLLQSEVDSLCLKAQIKSYERVSGGLGPVCVSE